MRHFVILALGAFCIFGIDLSASCQDSLSFVDSIGMTSGALFVPHMSSKARSDDEVTRPPGSFSLLILTPIASEEEKMETPYGCASNFGLSTSETQSSETLMVYAVEDKSIHAPHGHLCIGLDAPVANHCALLFLEIGATYIHREPLVLCGVAIPLHTKAR